MTDELLSHYSKTWGGSPTRTARFDVGRTVISVYKWAANANPEGVALYATDGMSAEPISDGGDPNHRIELILGLLPEKDDAARPLAMLASYPAREGVAIDHGHSVSFPEPLWKSTKMSAFLVMKPLGEMVPALRLGEKHVEFLQAIPIFSAELAFKSENGAEALLLAWERAGVPFWDPRRNPLRTI